MMVGKMLPALVLAYVTLGVSAAEPGTFVQRFEATFATSEVAQRAVVSAARLPPGKAFSYSQRWDDANPRHLKMADVLDPLGIRATFYINSRRPDFVPVMTNLLARGHSLGDHTVSHGFMQFLSPVAMFREIMDSRIYIETSAQSPVNAFSIPYGSMRMATDPASALRYGAALANAGLLGSPQSQVEIAAAFGLDPARWIGTHYFSINDNDPDERRFARGMDVATNLAVRADDAAGPHVTMGTHTWQTDVGLAKLSKILSSIAGRDDIWFVNENEWIAFRVQQLAARFRRVSVRDRTAVYEVTRPEPAALGADMPLHLVFSDRPVSVRAAGLPGIDILKEGLPAGKGHGLPVRYRKLQEGCLSVDDSLSRFACTIRNESGQDWSDGVATLRLPPGFSPGTVVRHMGPLAAGKGMTVAFDARLVGEPIEGNFYAAVQVDMRGPSGLERLWATCVKKRPAPLAAVPRDTCMVAGPFEEEKCPNSDFFTGLSRVGSALDDFADEDGKWRPAQRSLDSHPSVVCTLRQGWKAPDKRRRFMAYAYGLDVDTNAHGASWKLCLFTQSLRTGKERLFLNGQEVPREKPLTLVNGMNRLLVIQDFENPYNFQHEIAVISEKDAARAVFSVPIGHRKCAQ